MRIWNRNDSCGPVVVAKNVASKGTGYPIYKFVDVRLVVFPPFPADLAVKIAVDGITLDRLYHL